MNLNQHILIIRHWPYTSSINRTPIYFLTGLTYNILTINNFVGINMLLDPGKRKFSKGQFKGPKGHLSIFSLKLYPLDPYIKSGSEGINGKRSIPEFRYVSWLHPPLKKFACYYRFLGVKVTFLSKIWFSKWPFFLEIGLVRGKLKK